MNASAAIGTATPIDSASDAHEPLVARDAQNGEVATQPVAGAPDAPSEAQAQQDLQAKALSARVEALVVSSSRALPGVRIAQALGLMPPDVEEGAVAPLPAQADSRAADGVPTPVVKTVRRRRSTSKGGVSPLDIIKRAVELLNADYERTARSFRIEQVAGGYRVMTLPTFAPVIAALSGVASRSKLSQEALVTLAIIAYRQPVKRVDIEAIRGVACGEVLKNLLERRLVTIAGRAEELGRPMLYATTPDFLRSFGLSSIKDLPSPAELGLRAQ